MEKLRVGVIGAGANTRLRHLPGLLAMEGVSVEVVCNRSESSSRSVAEAFGIPRIASKWEEVVEDPNIDAVCIGTWPYLHAPITIAALNAGKHALTEARMAMNAEEGEAMLAASMNNPGLVAQIVPSPFTLKWDKTIIDILERGELGELREASFFKSLGLNVDAKAPMNWRHDKALSGNNTLMLGIYYEALQRWIRVEPERLIAHGSVFTKQRRKGSGGELADVLVPETINVVAEYESGMRLAAHMSGLELGKAADQFALAGSKGTLRLDLREGKLWKTLLGKEEMLVEPKPREAGEWNVEADFVDSIRNGSPVRLTNFEDGLAYMRFTDAAIRSVEADSAWETL